MRRKKMLLWSALGLASGGVQAQTPAGLTLYGVVDLGVQRTSSGGVSLTSLSNGGLSTSRLGFRGQENLGGGWSAGFWLEGSLNPDTGGGRATNTNNQANGGTPAGPLTFDRMSFVNLVSDRFGEVRLGRDFIPTHYNSIVFDPFNANGVARAGNLTFAATTTAPLPTTIAASNTVSYWLPKNIGGFYGMAMIGAGENTRPALNENDGSFGGARIGWTSGPFDIAAAWTRTSAVTTATTGRYVHANFGASYDFGFLRLFALYNQVEVRLASGDVKKNTTSLGAHIPVGGLGRIRLSVARLDDRSDAPLLNPNGSLQAGNDATQIGIGYVHTLSKRTALYGSYARITNRGQGRYVVSGAPVPLRSGERSSGVEFGVRHAF